MAIDVFDTFTVDVAEQLDAHTPDTGTGWTKTRAGTPANLRCRAAVDQLDASVDDNSAGVSYETDDVASNADNDVEITADTILVSAGDCVNIYGNATLGADDYYAFILDPDGTDWDLRLIERNSSGAPAQLASAAYAPSDGDVANIELRANSQKGQIDSGSGFVDKVTATDGTITAAGRGGIGMGRQVGSTSSALGNNIDNGWELDDFKMTSAGAVVTEKTETDGLLLDGPFTKHEDHLLPEAIQFFDQGLRERIIDLVFSDAIEMDDERGAGHDRPRGDQIFLLDSDVRDRVSIVLDHLLVADQRTAETLKIVIDGVFLDDSATAQKLKILVEVDTLFLRDNRTSDLTKFIVDAILVATLRRSELCKIVLDGVLVNTSQVVGKLKEVIAADGLFLTDERIAEVDKTIVNELLLLDVIAKIVDKIIDDGLFLLDDVILAETRAAFELAIVDGLFLVDSVIAAHDKTATDSVLLGDEDIKEQLKLLVDALFLGSAAARQALYRRADGILLNDATAADRALTATSGLLIRDVLMKTLKKIPNVDGLLLVDSLTKLVTEPSLIQALVFALLGFKDMLGADVGVADGLLAFKTSNRDLMSIETGAVWTGD